MDIASLSAQANSLLRSPSGSIPAGNAAFGDLLGRLQIENDISSRLQGIPRDTLTIPPNVLAQMSANPAVYDYYMNAIEEYAKAYRTYHRPGLLTMSFAITETGIPVLRGRNELVNRQAAAREKEKDIQRAPAPAADSPVTQPVNATPLSNGIYDSASAFYGVWLKRQPE